MKTVSVTFYKTKSTKKWQTKFTTTDRGLLMQIESADVVRALWPGHWTLNVRQKPWRFDGNALIVYDKAFSIAEASEMLGQFGLVLRHVEKSDSVPGSDILHFSSI